jgi:hypothetical protein
MHLPADRQGNNAPPSVHNTPAHPEEAIPSAHPGCLHRLPGWHLRSLAYRPHGSPSGEEGPVFSSVHPIQDRPSRSECGQGRFWWWAGASGIHIPGDDPRTSTADQPHQDRPRLAHHQNRPPKRKPQRLSGAGPWLGNPTEVEPSVRPHSPAKCPGFVAILPCCSTADRLPRLTVRSITDVVPVLQAVS